MSFVRNKNGWFLLMVFLTIRSYHVLHIYTEHQEHKVTCRSLTGEKHIHDNEYGNQHCTFCDFLQFQVFEVHSIKVEFQNKVESVFHFALNFSHNKIVYSFNLNYYTPFRGPPV